MNEKKQCGQEKKKNSKRATGADAGAPRGVAKIWGERGRGNSPELNMRSYKFGGLAGNRRLGK